MDKDLKIASHNTMSYLPVKQWYLKPFYWMARCQNKSIFQQYNEGCRFFDIRVKYYKGKIYFAHGIILYKGYVWKTLRDFHNYISESVIIRFILETSKEDISMEEEFYYDCMAIQTVFPKFKIHGGRRKFDWHVIFPFDQKEPTIEQKVSSMTGNIFDDIWPWLYAKLHNKENIKKGTDKEYLMIDFI